MLVSYAASSRAISPSLQSWSHVRMYNLGLRQLLSIGNVLQFSESYCVVNVVAYQWTCMYVCMYVCDTLCNVCCRCVCTCVRALFIVKGFWEHLSKEFMSQYVVCMTWFGIHCFSLHFSVPTHNSCYDGTIKVRARIRVLSEGIKKCETKGSNNEELWFEVLTHGVSQRGTWHFSVFHACGVSWHRGIRRGMWWREGDGANGWLYGDCVTHGNDLWLCVCNVCACVCVSARSETNEKVMHRLVQSGDHERHKKAYVDRVAT